MTLRELYSGFGEDLETALRVLRVEKLVDKHIRKLTKSGVMEALISAGEAMDPKAIFDAAHAAKGNCGNLGLTRLAAVSSEITEEFRPGNDRKMTDDEVKEKLAEIAALYEETANGIRRYEAENP